MTGHEGLRERKAAGLRRAVEILCRAVPARRRRGLRQRLRRLRHPAWLGTLRRTTPLGEGWGSERGSPVDRGYIESFLALHRADIRGRVLEVKDTRYVDVFGSGVTRLDVLDIDANNKLATIVADLSVADAIPSDSFDCVVATQVLQYVYDTREAVAHLARILAPGGVVLATVPGISRIGPDDLATDHWRFTQNSCRALFEPAFGSGRVTVRSYGNVLGAIAFLSGMAREELSPAELEASDPFFPVIVAVRACKAERGAHSTAPTR